VGLGGTSTGLLSGYICADALICAPGLSAMFISGNLYYIDVLSEIKLCYLNGNDLNKFRST